MRYFQEKPKWLLPTVVWMIVTPVPATIYAISNGDFDDMIKRFKETTPAWLSISIIFIYVAGLIVFGKFRSLVTINVRFIVLFCLYLLIKKNALCSVCSFLLAAVIWSYYKSKMEQQTQNPYQNRLTNPQVDLDV